MKRRDLERTLRALGWEFERAGGKHDVWSHPGKEHRIAVPRHTEINEYTARGIIRDATK